MTRAEIDARKAEWRAAGILSGHISDTLAMNEIRVGDELSRRIAERRARLSAPVEESFFLDAAE